MRDKTIFQKRSKNKNRKNFFYLILNGFYLFQRYMYKRYIYKLIE